VLKRILPIVIFTLLVNVTFSQNRKIIGRILDSHTQKPLRNANIILQGSTVKTFSNHLGFFELVVDSSKYKKLLISHVGFKTSEVLIPKEDRFKLGMEREYVKLKKLNLSLYPKPTVPDSIPSKKSLDELVNLESSATFPGGIDQFYDIIGNYLVNRVSGIPKNGLNINFTVTATGQIADLSISDSTQLLQNAILGAFQNIPAWVPASQGQSNVEEYFVLPLSKIEIFDNKSRELKELYAFIAENLAYPVHARRMSVQGAVFIKFRMDDEGNISNIQLLKDIGADCGEEVKRVIALLPIDMRKLLMEKTGFSDFIMPVFFGLNVPFKNDESIPNSESFWLAEIMVTAGDFVSKKRVSGYSNIETSTAIAVVPARQDTYTDLTKALKRPLAVKRLSMTNKELASLPEEIFRLEYLEFLDLERNQLKQLPFEIEGLTHLQELYLFENTIESLPLSFGNLKRMKVLGLASNQFKKFPEVITLLSKLEDLDLSDNGLTSIPASIGNLKNLKVLVLQNNKLNDLPKEIFGLKYLQKIYLKGNPIDPKVIDLLKKSNKRAEIFY
jgi:hypothetical protein